MASSRELLSSGAGEPGSLKLCSRSPETRPRGWSRSSAGPTGSGAAGAAAGRLVGGQPNPPQWHAVEVLAESPLVHGGELRSATQWPRSGVRHHACWSPATTARSARPPHVAVRSTGADRVGGPARSRLRPVARGRPSAAGHELLGQGSPSASGRSAVVVMLRCGAGPAGPRLHVLKRYRQRSSPRGRLSTVANLSSTSGA
jgi:hypothetical protein